MAIKLAPDEFALIRDHIEKISGIRVGEGKSYLIESRLVKLLAEYKCDTFRAFYTKLKTGGDKDLEQKVINAMSTRETLWFRDNHPYNVMKGVLLPKFIEELKGGKRSTVKIWSAASSTGQEPYSISMTILEYLAKQNGVAPNKFSIKATDIAPIAVETAREGKYDRIAMGRGMLPVLRKKYFKEDGRFTLITDEVKSLVKFSQFNLQNSFSSIGKADIVFLRNVAIYFSDEFKVDLYKKINSVLENNGILFLGASESISAYSSDFQLNEHDGAIYYSKK